MHKSKAAVFWSGGKDSALALFESLENDYYDIKFLVSHFDEDSQTLNIHGVHESLIQEQAESIGIPLRKFYLPLKSNVSYETAMVNELVSLRNLGITHIIFGDIFLEDLRLYREQILETQGMTAVFPLWKRSTRELLQRFFDLGFEAICCSSEYKVLAGKKVSPEIISLMPTNADPCGENGEYHCYCINGPVFRNAVGVTVGEILLREEKLNVSENYRYWQAELIQKSVVK